jgi:hypothetical protein
MRKGLADKIFIGLCIGLIVMCVISAVDYGIKGQYRDMHNSLNWVLWIGNTIVMSLLLRRQEVEIEVKDNYIKSLEEYKTLSDDHVVSMKELYQAQKDYSTGLEGHIEEYKKLNDINEKIIEDYKNAKPSRF